MIENFGSYLKHERELRGVPLEEISATTKIHIRFLQALEDNQFDKLPGEVFVKGYIRSFAKAIGFNEDEMLNAYDDTAGKRASTNGKNKSVQAEDTSKADKKALFGLGLAVIFLVGVGWGTNILIHKFSGSSKTSAPVMSKPGQKDTVNFSAKDLSAIGTMIEDESAPLKEAEEPSGSSIAIDESEIPAEKISDTQSGNLVQSVENPPETEKIEDKVLEFKAKPDIMAGISSSENEDSISPSVAGNGMPLKLTIRVKDNVWFNITVDESRVEDFILPKGAAKTFYGKDNFRMTLGNRNVVELKLNDQTLTLPEGDENKVVREFIINSQLIE